MSITAPLLGRCSVHKVITVVNHTALVNENIYS